MNKFQVIRESVHYQALKDSVEYRHWRKQFQIVAGFLAGYFLFLTLVLTPVSLDTDNPALLFLLLFLLAIYLPIVCHMLYRWLGIFLHIDRYIFQEALLDHPYLNRRGGVKYTVRFPDRQGRPMTRETSCMFSSNAEPKLEDYNNKTVLIGYNEETDRVVVLRLTVG